MEKKELDKAFERIMEIFCSVHQDFDHSPVVSFCKNRKGQGNEEYQVWASVIAPGGRVELEFSDLPHFPECCTSKTPEEALKEYQHEMDELAEDEELSKKKYIFVDGKKYVLVEDE